MPDLLIRAIDDTLAERIKRYTRERGLPLNSCMLEILNLGLNTFENRSKPENNSPAAGTMPAYGSEVMRETRILGGTWNSDEASAFREAMKAIENIPDNSGVK